METMNRTNVVALVKALNNKPELLAGLQSLVITTERFGQPYQRNGVVALAEGLAEQGVLAPAKDVLVLDDFGDVMNLVDSTNPAVFLADICAMIDRVAKGQPKEEEAP